MTDLLAPSGSRLESIRGLASRLLSNFATISSLFFKNTIAPVKWKDVHDNDVIVALQIRHDGKFRNLLTTVYMVAALS